MKNLFKSRLRNRIEKKISEIKVIIADIERDMAANKVKQTLTSKEYSHYSVLKSDLQNKVDLLESVLK